MKYFFDTEFIEDGRTIDLISIGIVSEDGRDYYAINGECDFSKANDWVVDNVLRPMGFDKQGISLNPGSPSVSGSYRSSYAQAKTKRAIASD